MRCAVRGVRHEEIDYFVHSCELAAAASEGFVGGMGWDEMGWLPGLEVKADDGQGCQGRQGGPKGRKIVKWKLRNVKCEMWNVCEMELFEPDYYGPALARLG